MLCNEHFCWCLISHSFCNTKQQGTKVWEVLTVFSVMLPQPPTYHDVVLFCIHPASQGECSAERSKETWTLVDFSVWFACSGAPGPPVWGVHYDEWQHTRLPSRQTRFPSALEVASLGPSTGLVWSPLDPWPLWSGLPWIQNCFGVVSLGSWPAMEWSPLGPWPPWSGHIWVLTLLSGWHCAEVIVKMVCVYDKQRGTIVMTIS